MAPPIPPLRSRSVPITDPQQHQTTHTTTCNPTPLAQNSLEQHFESSARLDTTDAESITNRLLFASEHLRERYRLADDNHETITPEAISSPSFHPSASRQTEDYHMSQTPSTDNEYLTPLQQPQDAHLMSNYQNTVPEVDIDESTYQ